MFRARVQSCIEKARLRRAELDHLRQVDRLITAAERMESSTFHPDRLGLAEVAARPDAVGRLGRVFRDMAEQVYDRERQLQRNIRTAKGTALLLFMGILGGLEAPISIMLYDRIEPPLGLAFWVNFIAGLVCLGVALARGKVGSFTPTLLAFLIAWAVLHGLSTVIMYEAAGRVTGIMLSIILALEAFTVFLIAAILRIEETSTRRFIGLVAGLAGVLVLLVARESLEGVNDWLWILVALTIPVIYGLMDVLVDQRHPATLDPTAGVGIMLLVSAILTLPVAALAGQVFMLSPALGDGAALIVLQGLRTAVVFVSYVYLIAVAARFGRGGLCLDRGGYRLEHPALGRNAQPRHVDGTGVDLRGPCAGRLRLTLTEEFRDLPFGEIWVEFCSRLNTPCGLALIGELDAYQARVAAARG